MYPLRPWRQALGLERGCVFWCWWVGAAQTGWGLGVHFLVLLFCFDLAGMNCHCLLTAVFASTALTSFFLPVVIFDFLFLLGHVPWIYHCLLLLSWFYFCFTLYMF